MEHSEMRRRESRDSIAESLPVCAGSRGESGVRCADGCHGFTYGYTENEQEKIGGVVMPSPCALGCTFDRDIARQVGQAVGSIIVGLNDDAYGKDASSLGYNAVISPDVGVVRNPLCGALADKFGEDPYLCGALGSEWVKGAQSAQIAVVLSHFGDGDQSSGKFTCDHRIDERALREIYLRPFETVVREAEPAAVRCGDGKLNGLYAGENYTLLTEMLRRSWGFGGAVLADMRRLDAAEAMACGVDMSFPKGNASARRRIRKAMRGEELPKHYPSLCAARVKRMADFDAPEREALPNEDECREIARKAAERGAVLLKNHKQTLPLPLSCEIALIGRYARYPRIQRGGVNALKTDSSRVKNILSVFDENQVHYRYCEGFDEHSATNDALLGEAVKCASESEFAVVLVGFDDDYDNNSADRYTNRLPKAQVRLINAVARANANTVVIVNSSALPKMNWIGRVRSVLYMPVGGEKVCEALFRLLFGFANPSGRLSVSYSLNESELPSSDTFGRSERVAPHCESVYVGYRYFQKAGLFPAFPFGYGLSYTEFAYSHMRASRAEGGWNVTVDVKNTGRRDGAEVVQFYVEAPGSDKFRPVRELKQFERVFLTKGEQQSVTVFLPDAAFERYDTRSGRFVTVAGHYRVCAAASSADIRGEIMIAQKGVPVPEENVPAWYLHPTGRPSEEDFWQLYGESSEDALTAEQYSTDSTLSELSGIGVFRFASKCVRQVAQWRIQPESRRSPEYAERLDSVLNMPLDRLSGQCHGLFPMKLTRLALWWVNRRGGEAKA